MEHKLEKDEKSNNESMYWNLTLFSNDSKEKKLLIEYNNGNPIDSFLKNKVYQIIDEIIEENDLFGYSSDYIKLEPDELDEVRIYLKFIKGSDIEMF